MYSGLAPGRLLVLFPTVSKHMNTSPKLWLNEFTKMLPPDILQRMNIVHDYDDASPENNKAFSIQYNHNGTHSLTDRSSFIYVLQETIRSLGGDLLKENVLVASNSHFGTVVPTSIETFLRNDIKLIDNNPAQVRNFPNFFSCRWHRMKELIPKIQWSRRLSANTMSVNPTNPNQLDTVQVELQAMYAMLDRLQNQQEEDILDTGNGVQIPMDFSSFLNPIVDSFISVESQLQQPTLANVCQRLHSLYQQHLELLRDYYGTMYETLFDNQSLGGMDITTIKSIQDRMVTSFRQAAERAALPIQRRRPSPALQQIANQFNYRHALTRFISDLHDATDLRKELYEDSIDTTVVDSIGSARRKRFVKFCKKLALRSIMLGINYIQGWIALQGIKRVALERERAMPKFPLF
jgi:hypothetical protein